MSDNIKEIPNTERDQLLAGLAQLSRVWSAIVERADEIAAARKAMFDAYVRQGFTESQALDLCRGLKL